MAAAEKPISRHLVPAQGVINHTFGAFALMGAAIFVKAPHALHALNKSHINQEWSQMSAPGNRHLWFLAAEME